MKTKIKAIFYVYNFHSSYLDILYNNDNDNITIFKDGHCDSLSYFDVEDYQCLSDEFNSIEIYKI